MGQLTETTPELQVVITDADTGNIGKIVVSDVSDTSATAAKKSGFHPLGAGASNAPNTERAVIITAVRDTGSANLRYSQILVTESNNLFIATDDNGTKSNWAQMATVATAQTLTNKTLTSPVLTTPQINDASLDHQYVFVGSELAADRNVTLPVLASDDEFVFKAATQTLTNKTLTSPAVTGMTGGAASGFTAGNLTLADGSITDSSGAISFGDENIVTTGTLGAGASTLGATAVTTLTASGDVTASGHLTGLFNFGGTNPTSASGGTLGWNFSNGGQETNIINRATGATKSFDFRQLTVSGTTSVSLLELSPAGNATLLNDFFPAVTESQDIGSASLEWDNIFLQNAATVSDFRTKNDLGLIENASTFLNLLEPKLFSRKEKVIKEAIPAKTAQVQKTETVTESQSSVEIIDGIPTKVTKLVDVQKPVFDQVQVVDENGVAVPDTIIPAVTEPVLDEEGNDTGEVAIITPQRSEPVLHPVPVMVDEVTPAEDEVWSSHSRPHSGFMAQSVKQAMTDAGILDWAGYVYHEDEDIHALRLMEFVAYLVAGHKELTARIEALEP
jgi:hypothetical protein